MREDEEGRRKEKSKRNLYQRRQLSLSLTEVSVLGRNTVFSLSLHIIGGCVIDKCFFITDQLLCVLDVTIKIVGGVAEYVWLDAQHRHIL